METLYRLPTSEGHALYGGEYKVSVTPPLRQPKQRFLTPVWSFAPHMLFSFFRTLWRCSQQNCAQFTNSPSTLTYRERYEIVYHNLPPLTQSSELGYSLQADRFRNRSSRYVLGQLSTRPFLSDAAAPSRD